MGLESEQQEKYSNSIVIESSASKKRYTLYMSYGEWRIGASSWTELDERALRALLS